MTDVDDGTLATRLVRGPFVRLPPGRRHVHVPVTSSAAALAGLSLVVGSRRSTVAVQLASMAGVRAAGPQALRGTRVSWAPPMPAEAWAALVDDLVEALGPVDGLAVYEQPQHERTGCGLLLLREGRAAAFVKMRAAEQPGAFAREETVLQAAERVAHPSFDTPAALAAGRRAGWSWLALSPLPPHRPLRREPAGLERDITAVLAELPRPTGTPRHWQPSHGDLTPWNLRTTGRRVVLLDWEHARWAPPGTDAVYLRAVLATITRSRPEVVPPPHVEAVHHWLARVQQRRATADDLVLTLELEAVLEQMLG